MDGVRGEPAGTPGGLEVVAADQAIEVEDFAGKVKAGTELAFESLRLDFVQGDAARGDFRLREAERPGDRQSASSSSWSRGVAAHHATGRVPSGRARCRMR